MNERMNECTNEWVKEGRKEINYCMYNSAIQPYRYKLSHSRPDFPVHVLKVGGTQDAVGADVAFERAVDLVIMALVVSLLKYSNSNSSTIHVYTLPHKKNSLIVLF